MHPKQTLINKAKSDGIIDYATTLISASHLVNSVAYTLVEEANEDFDLFLAATKKALKLPDCPTKKE